MQELRAEGDRFEVGGVRQRAEGMERSGGGWRQRQGAEGDRFEVGGEAKSKERSRVRAK